jgi:predicted RNA-binding protein (virulence factor B family)
MVNLGKINTLKVLKKVDFGLYLDGEELGEVLLPKRYVDSAVEPGDELNVFVYLDSEDLPIATTVIPKAMVGECAYLKVVEVNATGAFLDWGLPKDLLVPFGEQKKPMQVGQSYVVHLFLDQVTERITATTRIERHLAETSPYYKEGQKVSMLICGRTDLGYKAIVDDTVTGLIFNSDVIRPIRYGDTLSGYIKRIRNDKKLDLCLQLVNREALDELSQQVLAFIKSSGGETNLTDNSSPAEIAAQFGVSKSSYKKALGKLYKKRLILIEKHRISLVK